MTRWWTSDTHFGHARINELAGRPFASAEEMNRTLIDRWNDAVRPGDEVWHLGDVALGTIAETLPLAARLHGRKRLVIGNHDRIFAANRAGDRERFRPRYEALFELGCADSATTDVHTPRGPVTVNVSHFPYDGDSQEEERFRELRLPDDGTPLIHGHIHAKERYTLSRRGTPQLHVGVDAWDFRPVPESEIEAWAAAVPAPTGREPGARPQP